MKPDGGYVRVYRRVLGNPCFRNEGEAMAFVWLVMRAAWKATTVRYKGRVVELERGQLTISARDMGTHFDWSKSKVSRYLNTLEKWDMVGTVSGTAAIVITIRNYDKYQPSPEAGGTVDDQEVGQSWDSGGTQNKEDNKLKEKKTTSGDLAFDGKVIKLTQPDYARWAKAYPSIDLAAALQSRDDWLASEADEATRKRWYPSTSAWLSNRTQRAANDTTDKEAVDAFWG